MDIVNSVTQNSNNKNVTMENQPPIYHTSSISQLNQPQPPATMPIQMQLSSAASSVESSSEPAAMPVAPAKPPSETTKTQVPEYLRLVGMDPKKYWPKKYRFTREKTPGQHNPLTIAQRNFYENNGYLILDGCNQHKLIEAIRADYAKSPTMTSEFLVDKLVARNGNLLQYVRCFCDERVMLMTHRLVDTFQRQQHQQQNQQQEQRQQLLRDWIYLPFRPIDKVVCAITAIEPLDNVILVAPGTHKVGQCTITSSKLDAGVTASYSSEQASKQSSPLKKELFECSPGNLSSLVEKSPKGLNYVNLDQGQTLFYHPGLIHGFSYDLANVEKSQLATIAYYAAADCEYVEMRPTGESAQSASPSVLPIGLAHFKDSNPSDYRSWINRPKLLQPLRASL